MTLRARPFNVQKVVQRLSSGPVLPEVSRLRVICAGAPGARGVREWAREVLPGIVYMNPGLDVVVPVIPNAAKALRGNKRVAKSNPSAAKEGEVKTSVASEPTAVETPLEKPGVVIGFTGGKEVFVSSSEAKAGGGETDKEAELKRFNEAFMRAVKAARA